MDHGTERRRFRDRTEAGHQLAARLLAYRDSETLVLGIARGGVVVGAPIADALQAELDVIAPRKLPIPFNPEAGFGAIAEDGTMYLNSVLVRALDLREEEIREIAADVLAEVRRRVARYRGDRPPPRVKGRPVILVDDGLATGYTMLAAIESVKKDAPARLVVAVPVSPLSTLRSIEPHVDELICLIARETEVFAVADFYEDFRDLRDEEVIALLERARSRPRERSAS
ncbi:MAG: phosphoribosyltransferase family protein [Blastocatellia bacterium]|nr:phosphoribosyltransferase family protein [Blastocatellia bacterium]MCS7156879.1 phosphoribosyltransferase family protein [Blastocatellia bacterium]MCX7752078.1 phosphoribosyltransferase family protein [Blastocatellia bacterium]MDW8167571.1 phosphoribosyltransferase family protein [Acidobacteriota bacterium]MDW8256171.1 phosphoribosyltransferase family protein [Acidobacteriota bacterium]